MIDEIQKIAGLEINNREKLASGDIDGIVIVGSSCSGKTTLARAVSQTQISGVIAPERLTTRAPRDDDKPGENRAISEGEFQQHIEDDEMSFHWTKSGTDARYGFLSPDDEGSFPVYSGNNAFLRPESDLQPTNALKNILVVGIAAPREDREKRILSRSPDLPQEELNLRLNDEMDDIMGQVDVVIHNPEDDQKTPAEAIKKLTEIVSSCTE